MDFVVLHARAVSLRLIGTHAKGSVGSPDGPPSCASDVLVRVQHLDGRDWHVVDEVGTLGKCFFQSPNLKPEVSRGRG